MQFISLKASLEFITNMLSSCSISHDSNIPKDISFFFSFFPVSRWTLAQRHFICHITTWQIQCHNWIEKTLLCFYNLCCLAWARYNPSQFGFTVTFVRSLQWVRAAQIEGKLIHPHVVIAWNLVPLETPLLRQRFIHFHSDINGKLANGHEHNVHF